MMPAAAAVVIIVTLPPWPREVFAIGTAFFAPMFATTQGLARGLAELRLLYYRDGINTTISVDLVGEHLVYRSNGKTDASTYPRDMANQVMLGQVPMFLHPGPRDVFVLGLGTGRDRGRGRPAIRCGASTFSSSSPRRSTPPASSTGRIGRSSTIRASGSSWATAATGCSARPIAMTL